MTISTIEPAAVEPFVATGTVATLVDWARELDAAHAIATKLVVTPFAPAHFKNKPADAAAAILTGHELGLSPMAALRSIFMISGTPGLYAKAMVAVAQSRGHQVHVVEQSDERVVVRGRRRGEAEVYETVWTPERVKTAGLESNAKYRTSRQQMMVARGQAEIARQVASDALHGVPYSVEELEDLPPIRATAAVDRPRPATLAEIIAPTSPEPEPEVIAAPPDKAATPAQTRMMYALLKQSDRSDRDVALVYISGVLGREVNSTKELTTADAGRVIDALNAEAAEKEQGEPELELES